MQLERFSCIGTGIVSLYAAACFFNFRGRQPPPGAAPDPSAAACFRVPAEPPYCLEPLENTGICNPLEGHCARAMQQKHAAAACFLHPCRIYFLPRGALKVRQTCSAKGVWGTSRGMLLALESCANMQQQQVFATLSVTTECPELL